MFLFGVSCMSFGEGGYYYLVTVMDDYSRFILAWKLQKDMLANSLIEVIQEAVGCDAAL